MCFVGVCDVCFGCVCFVGVCGWCVWDGVCFVGVVCVMCGCVDGGVDVVG